jgi:hypothetical protein
MRLQNKIMIAMLGIGLAAVPIAIHAADSSAAMTPEQQAMMQKAEQYMTPGTEHKALEPMVGRWNAKVTMWMKPGDKPQESTGVAEMVWVLNNHFMKQDYHGMMMGKPFEGIGYTGYDKVRGEYQSIWMDNMATGLMYSTGPGGGGVVKQSGTFGCPMTGDKAMWMRSEMKINSPNQITYTSYGKDASGKEFKGMEIVYTRAS